VSPAVAAVLVGEQAGQALGLDAVEPGVDRIRVARAEQTGTGDGMGGAALGDLKQGGATFADVGPGVVVTVAAQLLALVLGEGKGSALGHREFLLFMFRYPHLTEFGRQNSSAWRSPRGASVRRTVRVSMDPKEVG